MTGPIRVMIMSGVDDGLVVQKNRPAHDDAYILGRREDCDFLFLYDSQISRQHASLFQIDEVWYVKDLDSRNGTFINKTKAEGEQRVHFGEMIRIGRTWLRLEKP